MRYIFLLLLTVLLVSCDQGHTDIDKVRLLKNGMMAAEVERVLDTKPWSVEIENGYEEWYYSYSFNNYRQTLHLTLTNGVLTDFRSY